MKIARSDDKQLVIVSFPWILSGTMLLIAGGLMANMISSYLHAKVITPGSIIGASIGLLILVCTLVFAQRSIFIFDRVRCELDWCRAGLFGATRGVIPFQRISGATIETMTDEHGGLCYRVSLTLSDGSFPLTASYGGGTEKRWQRVRDAINVTLGKPVAADAKTPDDDIRALVAGGRMIEAIARVRKARRCSLAEAKEYVEALK